MADTFDPGPAQRSPAVATAGERAGPRSEALRELQARLATQLEAAQNQQRGRAWLAVECGTLGFLLPLNEAGEIFPYRGSVAVPHTRPWFLGVANLRGALHGVVDLGRFLGMADGRAPPSDGWLVALNPRLDSNGAVRVDRLSGLRREDQLQALPEPAEASADARPTRPKFARARFVEDGPGEQRWQEISLVELAADPHFLSIAAPP